MTVILFRTIIFYIMMTVLMRLMGKRQIGEVQLSEFVAITILSEIAADRKSTRLNSTIEIITAFVCKKSPVIRKIIDGSPITLVKNGKLIQENLTKTRITPNEIEAEVRVNGYRQLQEIDTVILEQTGKMSVLPKTGKAKN